MTNTTEFYVTQKDMAKVATFDTTTTETAAWIPDDVYARAIFMVLHQKRVLGNLAAAIKHDIGRGVGDTIKVRLFPRRTAQGPIAEGASLTMNAQDALSVVPITIEKFGDWTNLTDESITFTSDDVKGRTLVSMADALVERLEQETYDTIADTTMTGVKTQTLGANGVVDYQDVLSARAKLKGAHMTGTYLVISAEHEVDLLLDGNLTKTVDYGKNEVSLAGEIGRIGTTRVLVHALANDKSEAADEAVQGVLLDKSRAFGEAFGKPLRFHEEYVPESDKYKEVAWVWYGVAVIHEDAIVHLKNAAA